MSDRRRNLLLLGCGGGIVGGSSFPTVVDRTTGGENDFNTTVSLTLPASASSGQLILAVVRFGALATITNLNGLTALGPFADADNTYVLYKTATGSEGSAISITINSNSNAAFATWLITGFTGVPEALESASADPPSLAPAAGSAKYLWIASVGRQQSNVTYSGAPTDYTDLQFGFADPGDSSLGDPSLATAERFLEASSEDPGTFTATQTPTMALTIAVQGT